MNHEPSLAFLSFATELLDFLYDEKKIAPIVQQLSRDLENDYADLSIHQTKISATPPAQLYPLAQVSVSFGFRGIVPALEEILYDAENGTSLHTANASACRKMLGAAAKAEVLKISGDSWAQHMVELVSHSIYPNEPGVAAYFSETLESALSLQLLVDQDHADALPHVLAAGFLS